MDNKEEIKSKVQDYWSNQACGTQFTSQEKFSKDYFEEIEEKRYSLEPEIHSFAQFTRFNGKKLLEVGVGAGTDFLQWARAGAEVYGIDLTEEAIEHVKHRLSLYGFTPKEIKVADSENIPFDDNTFDVVYSWGVIHHTPNTAKAMNEIIRVCKPGGICKVMIYHRHSLLAYFFWVKYALLRAKPLRSLSTVLYNYMESIGTKAYTKKEVLKMLAGKPIENIKIKPILTYHDRLGRFNLFFRFLARIAAAVLGYNKVGWFLTIEFKKKVLYKSE